MDYFEKISSRSCHVTSNGSTNTSTNSKAGETDDNYCYENVKRDPSESIDIITSKKGEIIPFCHIGNLGILIRLSSDGENFSSRYSAADLQYYVAAELAIHHLNTGNGSFVQEIAGLNETCPIRFTMEAINTAGYASVAIPALFQVLRRDEPLKSSPDFSQKRLPLPCAFLGATNSRVSVPTSIMSGYLGYPQISFKSTSPYLNNKQKHNFFGRTIPADDGTAVRIIDYFLKINVSHLAVLFVEDDYGIAFSQALQKNNKLNDETMKLTTAGIPSTSHSSEIEIAISTLKDTNYRYFFAIIIGQDTFDQVMLTALEQNILGPGYTWMFGDGVDPNFFIFDKTSPLIEAAKGTSIIQADAEVPQRFETSWKESIENNKEYLNTKLPKLENDFNRMNETVGDILLGPEAGKLSSAVVFAYDAVIALGKSACTRINTTTFKLNGKDHFDEFKKTNFHGVSGHVIFNDKTASRESNSAMFMVTNMFGEEMIAEIGKTKLKAFESEKYINGNWETVTKYVYSDGGTVAHPDLPDLQTDYMYIGTPLRICVWLLMASSICMSIGFMAWTFLNRKQKVVQVSQPFFLYIICIGTILMSLSVIPKGYDEEVRSLRWVNRGCMVFPWLIVVGFSISFSALFAKTWRINQLFHNPDMKRKQVLIKDVIFSMLTIPLISILLLIAWTIVSPLRWKRVVIEKDPFGRIKKSRGFCSSPNSWPFVGCLLFVLFCAIVIALKQLYLSRNIKMEFGESRHIATAISGMALIVAFALPILFLASNHPQAEFFVFSFFIIVTCTLILLFMFIPKIRFHRAIIRGKRTMTQVVQEFARQSVKSKQKASRKSSNSQEQSNYKRESSFISGGSSCFGSIQLSQTKTQLSFVEKLDMVAENN